MSKFKAIDITVVAFFLLLFNLCLQSSLIFILSLSHALDTSTLIHFPTSPFRSFDLKNQSSKSRRIKTFVFHRSTSKTLYQTPKKIHFSWNLAFSYREFSAFFFWSFLFAYLDAFHWRTRKNKRKNPWNHTDWHAIDRCLNRWTIFISSPHCCFNLSAIYFDNIVFMLLSCQFCWVSLFLSTSEYKPLKYADFMAFEQKHFAFQIIARTV